MEVKSVSVCLNNIDIAFDNNFDMWSFRKHSRVTTSERRYYFR